MFADYDFYCNQYLGGRNQAVPDECFSHYMSAAETEIRYATQNRVGTGEQSEEVKRCACELAEFLYRTDKVQETAAQAGTAGPLVSYSNDGQSASFQVSESDFTVSGRTRKVASIIRKHLIWTGLLYRGCRR